MLPNLSTDAEELIRKIDARLNEIEAASTQEEQIIKFDEALDQLNNLIGLKNVKDNVIKLINYLKFIKKIEGKANLEKLNLNMVFKGNPGTGKTTVARIMANILYGLGYLKNNNVIETTPKDFIAGYIGQTAIKTNNLINNYKGGLIFIDEAYGFNDNSESGFASDAITEIIKEMEQKDTVFIFAGYSKEMEDFIALNPGLKSRIGYVMDFRDYSEEELIEIFLAKLSKNGFYIENAALDEVKKVIKEMKKEKNFGNGRLIDNLYDKIMLEHATLNFDSLDEEELVTIKSEAVHKANFQKKFIYD